MHQFLLGDHHTHTVINKETLPDFCSRMDFYTGQKARKERNPACQQPEIQTPKLMRQPVKHHCMKPWVAQKHLCTRARSRITGKYGVNFL